MPAFSAFHSIFAALIAFLSIAVGASAATATIVATDARAGLNGTETRFVIELSEPVQYRAFTLSDPDRVVLDLPEVGWRLPSQPLANRVGVLDRFRYGRWRPGVSRVVLELRAPAAIVRTFLLDPRAEHGWRLVIDLGPIDRAAFDARAGLSGAVGPTAAPARESGAEAASLSRFRLPPHKPRPPQKRIVVIDPGHGGIDPGTLGAGGTYEKHITLAAARTFKDLLEGSGRYTALLTRDRDTFIRLRDRVDFARRAGAELFISVHADSIADPEIQGLSVYTLSEKASDREAAALADKENKADLIAGADLTDADPEVANILIDLAQRETMNESIHFASQLVDQLRNTTRLLRKSRRFAGFAVLKAPDVPSVLVELGFLSNPADERALRRPSYRAKLGAALVKAVDRYFARVQEANRF